MVANLENAEDSNPCKTIEYNQNDKGNLKSCEDKYDAPSPYSSPASSEVCRSSQQCDKESLK